ncbi:MAG: hypothetical protein EXR72_19410 [Myxococcales bacterium]|nr:hypothetical protein [Myxococcales bacterium]
MGRVAYLCTDLLFTSKIRETAQSLGVDVSGARDVAALCLCAVGADLVIIDLRLPAAMEALGRLRGDAATSEVPTVGFCEHERLDRMAEARAAGCTHVLAKGRFSTELKSLFPAHGDTGRAP